MAPTPVFFPGKSNRQRSLAGCSPWGLRELDTTEHAHTYGVCVCLYVYISVSDCVFVCLCVHVCPYVCMCMHMWSLCVSKCVCT